MDILSNTLTSTAYPCTTTLSYQSLFPINCERSLCYWYIVNQYLKACLQMRSAYNRIKLFTIMVIRLQALCHGKHSSKYSIGWGLFDSSSRSTCLNSNYLRLPPHWDLSLFFFVCLKTNTIWGVSLFRRDGLSFSFNYLQI